jgi:multidrug efflux pump subunit AcrA (membrane-fusion protein)
MPATRAHLDRHQRVAVGVTRDRLPHLAVSHLLLQQRQLDHKVQISQDGATEQNVQQLEAELAKTFSSQSKAPQAQVELADARASQARSITSMAPSALMPDDQELDRELDQLEAKYNSRYAARSAGLPGDLPTCHRNITLVLPLDGVCALLCNCDAAQK